MSAKILRLRGAGTPTDDDAQPAGAAVMALAAQAVAAGATRAVILYFDDDGIDGFIADEAVSTAEAVYLAEVLKKAMLSDDDDGDA